MQKKYFSYRPTYLNQWAWKYTLSYFCDQQYADYVQAWLTSIKDCLILDDRYTKETYPWIKSLRRFGYMECNEQFVNIDEFANNLLKVWANFDIELLDVESAKAFIREWTDLQEIEDWKFEISSEMMGPAWDILPAIYLEIC